MHWRYWEEGYILFNATSGQTHFLNEMGAAVLKSLKEAVVPLNTNQIYEQIAADYNLIIDTPLQSYIGSLLMDLDRLGLIEPCNA